MNRFFKIYLQSILTLGVDERSLVAYDIPTINAHNSYVRYSYFSHIAKQTQ